MKTKNINKEKEDEEGDHKLIDMMMEDHEQPTKLIYDRKINNKCKRPEKQLERWKEELNIETDQEILSSHCSQRQVIINQRIKSYNYMFMQRNIPFGARLYQMKISDNEECEYCKEKETMKHLYWDCPHSARLWERLKEIIGTHLHSYLSLDPARCMLGTGKWISKRNKECIWFLCILTKHYIHLCKCNGSTKNAVGLDNYIKSQLRTERILSGKRRKTNLFIEKWEKLFEWLDT